MNIFVSHPLALRDLALRLQHALTAKGHAVTTDRARLAAGRPLQEAVNDAIATTDVFVFVLSPQSVAADSYTLAELAQAQQRWPDPKGRVITFVAQATPEADIPTYLRASQRIEAGRNCLKAVVEAAQRLDRRQLRVRWRPVAVGALCAGLIGASTWAASALLQQRSDGAMAIKRVAAAQRVLVDCQERQTHADSFSALEAMVADNPTHGDVHTALQDCAMSWLRDGHALLDGRSALPQVLGRIAPVLQQALRAQPVPQRQADLQAHLGWTQVMLWRDGHRVPRDPAEDFRAALAADPANPFAHAMMAQWLMAQEVAQTEVAAQHLDQAIASGRQLAFVRRLQLATWAVHPQHAHRALLALNAMRQRGEPQDRPTHALVWDALYAHAHKDEARHRLVSHLSPEDAIKTFLWFKPRDARTNSVAEMDPAWRLTHGLLLSHAGRSREAKADLAVLHAEVRTSQGVGAFSRAVDRLLTDRVER